MNELTENKQKKGFYIKLGEWIKEDLKETQRKPKEAIIEFIKNIIIYLTIGTIILFFITRPIHCYDEKEKQYQIEEYKFNYKNITKCEYTYKKEITNTYKAITTKIYITEEDTN